MKFILLIFITTIFFNGCTPIETKPLGKRTSETTTTNAYDYRWIDNTDVLDLIDFSLESAKINHKDVVKKLGEPIFSEKLFLDKDDGNKINSLLFWYRYKSRIYPVAEQVTTTTKRPYKDAMGNNLVDVKSDIKEFEQIKPSKAQDHGKWESGSNWLVVIMFDNTFELVMTNELGTTYAINRDNYNLADAGFFESKQVDWLDDLKIFLKETIEKIK